MNISIYNESESMCQEDGTPDIGFFIDEFEFVG